MDPYVPKRRTAVRVRLSGGDPFEGLFCLAIDLPDLRRAETVLDLLNSSRRMVPFVRRGDQRVVLLARLNIEWVLASRDLPPELIYPPHFVVAFEEPVRIEFVDGRCIEGALQVELGAGTTRSSDFLNGPGDFFPVVTELGIVLTNKFRVRETLLVDSQAAFGVRPTGSSPEAERDAASG